MKTFEERFPSFSDKWEECDLDLGKNTRGHKSFCQCMIEKHCFDQQRLDEAITRIVSWYESTSSVKPVELELMLKKELKQ